MRGSETVRRVLVVHSDADVRASLEQTLRTAAAIPLIIESAPSPSDALRRARSITPHVVFLDLDFERALVLRTIAELRAPGRLIVGLYNPLVLRDDLPFVREATRAGVGDFIPLPASEGELLTAIAASGTGDDKAPTEGRVIAFYSQQGGVGATTLAVNTALLLAGSDQVPGSVVLCDAAPQFGVAAEVLTKARLVDSLEEGVVGISFMGVLAGSRGPNETARSRRCQKPFFTRSPTCGMLRAATVEMRWIIGSQSRNCSRST